MKFYIDAGHGGNDVGAVGVGGVHEADINLAVAKHLQVELERNGHAVKMCRTTDIQRSLAERTEEANKWGADYFISIHANWAEDATANGTETFCYKFGGNGEKMAVKVQKHLLSALSTKDRGIKEANFYVLRKSTMPAILIELGFISNKSDCGKLTNSNYQKNCAIAICKGICEYFGKTYKGESAVTNDNTPNAWAKDAVKWAVDNGILKGDENGNYKLHDTCTREDVLVFLHRALTK